MENAPNYDGLDARALRRMLLLRDHQAAISRKFWIRDAEEALAGDLRALRNRVEMAKMGPLEVVLSQPSDAEHA